jgi:hypothetical protein
VTLPASAMVDDEVVTSALIDWLTANLVIWGAKVGDADTPADAQAPPFVEVRQLPDGENPSGGWAQPLGVRGLKFQLFVVGLTRRQAQGLASRVREYLFELSEATQWQTPMPIFKHTVIGRESVSNLGYVKSGRSGGYLMHVRLLVQRTQV